MDKALNQLSVPLGQLREEVMVRVVCVFASFDHIIVFINGSWLFSIAEPSILCERGDWGHRQPAVQTGWSAEKEGSPIWISINDHIFIFYSHSYNFSSLLNYLNGSGLSEFHVRFICPPGMCFEADPGRALSGEDWEDPALTELQRIQLSGNQQVGNKTEQETHR